LFFGSFALFNLAGAFLSAGFDANLWWIDLRVLSAWCARSFLFVSAILLVAFALRPLMSRWRRVLTVGAVASLCLAAILNAAKFYWLLGQGKIGSGFPLPLSFLVTLGLSSILLAAVLKPASRRQAE
jgi:hypothetical protein